MAAKSSSLGALNERYGRQGVTLEQDSDASPISPNEFQCPLLL